MAPASSMAEGSKWNASGRIDLDSMTVVAGGLQKQASSSVLFQWGGSFDTAADGLWRGGLAEFSVEGVRAWGNPATSIGASQLPSNEWAPSFFKVYQLTYRQDWGQSFVRAGIMDLNQYFESSDQASLLHNGSFGMAPNFTANFDEPSFPNPGLAVMGETHWGSGWQARGGIWQGRPSRLEGALNHGALYIGELEYDWTQADRPAPTSDIKIGAWHYSLSDAAIGPTLSGGYLVGETRWQAGARQLGTFILIGDTPESEATVTRFVGIGVLATGLLVAQPDDQFSLALTQVGLPAPHPETVVEAVYSWQYDHDLALQPDVQFLRHPNGVNRNTWVAGIRTHFTF